MLLFDNFLLFSRKILQGYNISTFNTCSDTVIRTKSLNLKSRILQIDSYSNIRLMYHNHLLAYHSNFIYQITFNSFRFYTSAVSLNLHNIIIIQINQSKKYVHFFLSLKAKTVTKCSTLLHFCVIVFINYLFPPVY